jgi:transposase InsO family protein
MLESIPARALLDTGSQVSCLSESFWKQQLSHVEIKRLETLLEVEGAGGTLLPYLGYIEIDLTLPGKVLGDAKTMMSLFLVTQDTRYNRQCPVLIGTNIISHCLELHHEVDHIDQIPDAWKVAFQCVVNKSQDETACTAVKIASAVPVAPMSSIVVDGIHCGQQWNDATPVLLDASPDSTLPSGLLVTPAVYCKQDVSNSIPVHVVNLSHKVVCIPETCVLGSTYPVKVMSTSVDTVTPSTQTLDAFPLEHLDEQQRQQVHQCVERHRNAFSWSEWDLGHCDRYQHRIKLTDETPFRDRYRRIPPAMVAEVREHIKQMLEAGIIRESCSPYSSASVFVRKPDGSLRYCIDFRRLNARTVKDNHYLPRIDDTFDRLAGSSWYSNLDLKSGYWQCGMHPDDIKYTGFSCGNLGYFEFLKLPMGLVNSGASFQRLMESVMGSLNLEICLLYLDDIIVFSDSFDSHLQRLDIVLGKLEEAGLKLKPSKCNLFKRQIRYLGHVLSERGIETDPDKVEKVRNWPTPIDRQQLHRFLAFCGYYRRFIQDFARLAFPLQKLLRCIPEKKKEKDKPKDKIKAKKKSHLSYPPFEWGPEQQSSFEKLVDAITSTPVLAYADFSKPFVLQTDASQLGLGAILSQEVDGKLHPIAYASRGLTAAEGKYPAHKLEFLALKWAITQKYYDYLYGAKFEVITDNNPLTYVMSSAKLDATGLRWVAALSSFDFSIRYKPGKQNGAADALSRLDNGYLQMSDDTVRAVCNGASHDDLITTISMSLDVIPDDSAIPDSMSQCDWSALQSQDEAIHPVRQAILKLEKFTCEEPEARRLWSQRKRLIMEGDVLYRTRQADGKATKQLVLPRASRQEALKLLHDEMGHFGRDRVLDLVRARFFWPGMSEDVVSYVGKCMSCMKRKRWEPRAELVNITTSYPMEIVSMDFLGLESSIGGYSNILVLTDHFTRFAMAVPTKNQTAKTTAKCLVDLFINHYGLPHRLHSDNGSNFTSQVIREMCKMLGIKRSTTTVYHPSGNGQTEKFNKSLLDMMATLPEMKKSRWKDYVQTLVHAYNCTKNSVTGFSPFHLMFGREPRLPIDHKFGLVGNSEELSYKEFVEDLRHRLEESYKIARSNIGKAQGTSKKRYDQRVRGNKLDIGDKVLMKKTNFEEGKHKLANKWEDKVFIVQKKLENIPVYEIRPESGGKVRRIHRNNLLPIQKKSDGGSSSSSSSSDEEIQLHMSVSEEEVEPSQPPEPEPVINSDSSDSSESPARPIPRRSGRDRRQPDFYQAGVNVHQTHNSVGNNKVKLLSQIMEFLNK